MPLFHRLHRRRIFCSLQNSLRGPSSCPFCCLLCCHFGRAGRRLLLHSCCVDASVSGDGSRSGRALQLHAIPQFAQSQRSCCVLDPSEPPELEMEAALSAERAERAREVSALVAELDAARRAAAAAAAIKHEAEGEQADEVGAT